jgi:hypothetical protein
MIWKYALPSPRLIRVAGSATIANDLGKSSSNDVTLYIDRNDGPRRKCATSFTPLREYPAASVPALLSVCRESRRISLKAYDFAFVICPPQTASFVEVTNPNPFTLFDRSKRPRLPVIERIVPHVEIARPRIRFQPRHDTIYLEDEIHLINEARVDELQTQTLRSLAVSLWCFINLEHRLLGYEAGFFSGLEELIIVVRRGER